jgi:hypothetical protein
MDVHKRYREFKGKNAMLGFDPAGKMLYLSCCRNEDIFLAMAPNCFLQGHFTPTRAGYSTGKSNMSLRHYRQTVMMLVHFLVQIPELAFYTPLDVYGQSLDAESKDFTGITDTL